ncbi:MAG: dinitrogenase iron-molybdenum cofactor biosynthesis domain-containing protein [Desulfobulbus propionicus]|nr:MAG: dinitrogenase iron-molybdenum cofactor biosynthesis domain-containing protein [Desulfobulbus propionicus]
MQIAVTVWEDRISPVFDAAKTLLVADVSASGINRQGLLAFDPEDIEGLLYILRSRRVQTLICGAVSEFPASRIEASGVQLVSFIAGKVDEVLKRCCGRDPAWGTMRMPGCGKSICCCGRIRQGHELIPVVSGSATLIDGPVSSVSGTRWALENAGQQKKN